MKRPSVASEENSSSKRFSADQTVESVSNMVGAKAKEWRSFWVPGLNPTAEASKIEKPV